LVFFEAIWHFFTSGLTFFIQLVLATLTRTPESNHMICCSPVLYLQTSQLRFKLQLCYIRTKL